MGTGTVIVLIIFCVILFCLIWYYSLYNRIVSLKTTRENAWSDIDVQLRMRFDLVDNLVETVK
jgi:LemA protein